MHDDKVLIPIEDYAALIQAQTQINIVKNIVKRYQEKCVGGYIDSLLLHDILDIDPAESNGGN